MGDLSRYKVVLDGTVLPDANREQVVRALCELFHSRPSRMEKLLGGEEVSLKKEYPKNEAVNICKAIREAGARCKLIPVDDHEIAFLDDDSALSDFSENQITRTMPCPDCGKDCDPNWSRCRHCNHLIDEYSESDDSIQLEPSEIAVSDAPRRNEEDAEAAKSRSSRRDAVRAFVGPNADYYLKQFSGMGGLGRPRFKPRWHWPSLFFFPFWALYRKLWVWVGAYYASSFLVVMLGGSTILVLLFTLAWPLVANSLYFRHVAKHLRMVDGGEGSVDSLEILQKRGGVSRIALWAGLAISMLVFMYTMGNIKTTLLEAYDERFGTDSSASAIQYSDGSPVLVEPDQNSPLGRTVERFRAMGTALKIVIAAGSGEALDRAIGGLQQKASEQDLRDGWDSAISIERADGVITLRSAGADGQAGTPDDLLQRIPYSSAGQDASNQVIQ